MPNCNNARVNTYMTKADMQDQRSVNSKVKGELFGISKI